jgi:hypothetical protein
MIKRFSGLRGGGGAAAFAAIVASGCSSGEDTSALFLPERPAPSVTGVSGDGAPPEPSDNVDDGEGGQAGVGGTAVDVEQSGSGGRAAAGDGSGPSGAAGTNSDEGTTEPAPGAGAFYALAVLVFGPENTTTTYVSVFNSLDVNFIDLGQAYEFGGASDIASHGGNLYVSSGESPTITRYTIDADGRLGDELTMSFANLGLLEAPLRSNTFISATKAYLLAPTGQHVIWNPSTMEITGVVEVPDMNRENMVLDGSSGIIRGNRLYRTFYWEDWATYTFSTEQYVATYDTDADVLLSLEPETRCPNLGAVAVKDESDTVYLSNWFYNVQGTLLKDQAKSCTLRIPSGTDAVDPDWSLTFSDVTGGHEGAQLSYVGGGKAVFAAFHEESMSLGADTEPYAITSNKSWEAWSIDLETRQATAIAGVDWMVADQTVFTLDGRTFLLAPGEDWETTAAYELLPSGGSRLAFSIDGWSRGFVKVK